ncbi:response regulator, partial [Streptococcus pyogenes]
LTAPAPPKRSIHRKFPVHCHNGRVTRILIVEDEASLHEPLAFLLKREGYEIEVVESGLEAVEVFDRDGADLILLDL